MKEYILSGDRDFDLWIVMQGARYWINSSRKKELREYGLGPEQAGVIWMTKALNNHAKPIDIARYLHREPQTITSMLDRIAKKGLIKKTKDKERKNVVRVSLTSRGEKAYSKIIKRESIHSIMSALGEKEKAQLKNSLEELIKAAKNYIKLSTEL